MLSQSAFLARLVCGSIVSLACWPVLAQTQGPSSTGAEQPGLVILNVRVTDSSSHAVLDIARDSFRLAEDDVPQKISFFSREQIPVTYGLLIDCSGSLHQRIEEVIQTGAKVINSNKHEDEAFLVRFIDSDKIEVVQDVTSDKGLLIDGLDTLYIEPGQTALIDAVYLAAQRLVKRKVETKSLRRYALILVTDGEDRASYYKAEQLFRVLGGADIQIYAIDFTNELKGKKKELASGLLTRLATDTGGRVFFPQTKGELARTADEIINDIRTQYLIGYIPVGQKADNSFHKVEVSITNDPDKEKRIAITRLGYSLPKREKK